MELKKRNFQSEEDYGRLRDFLRETFILYGYREFNWQVARLDYWRFFINPNIDGYALHDAIHIWETKDRRVVAFIIPDGRANVYLQVHPEFRTEELEAEMLEVSETYLAAPDSHGRNQITTWSHPTDQLRIQILRARGYTRGDWPEHQFRCSLETEIAETLPEDGYVIRALGDASEIPARSWLSWRVFHPDEPDEKYQGWAWYHDVQRCPLYRRDLDLVAVAGDGELAAFCTIWYDDVTRTGYFEPVGTSPDHQRKGLGKAIMCEGLRRIKHMGAVYATVAGYSEAAIALYGSIMSPEDVLFERWYKS